MSSCLHGESLSIERKVVGAGRYCGIRALQGFSLDVRGMLTYVLQFRTPKIDYTTDYLCFPRNIWEELNEKERPILRNDWHD